MYVAFVQPSSLVSIKVSLLTCNCFNNYYKQTKTFKYSLALFVPYLLKIY